MANPKIKQIAGLQTALDTKGSAASNEGAGQGLYKAKSGTTFQFYTLASSAASVIASSPSSDIISLSLNIAGISGQVTTPAAGDRIPIMDDSDSDITKYITWSDIEAAISTGSGPVDIADYTGAASADADSIIFFDDSASDAPKIETKADFLQYHAKLASPTFTGTPAAPTATSGTNTTQIATTAFVKTAVDNALSGLDYQKDVLDIQTDNTLNPGTPTTGDRYIITNAASLHAGFGSPAGLANNDIVEYDGAAFIVSYDVSVRGEGALVWDRDSNDWYRWDGTSWDAFEGLSEITAGAGLAKTGNTLSVNVDDSTIEIATDTLRIKTTFVGQTSITTVGTITTGTWNGTTVALAYGGTGKTAITAHSLWYSNGTANALQELTMGASTFLLRKSSGNIIAGSKADAREVLGLRQGMDEGTLTASSMTLATLSNTPDAGTLVEFAINGLLLDYGTDYTVSGTTVTATSALNIAYGGSGSDGAGFANDDVYRATYTY